MKSNTFNKQHNNGATDSDYIRCQANGNGAKYVKLTKSLVDNQVQPTPEALLVEETVDNSNEQLKRKPMQRNIVAKNIVIENTVIEDISPDDVSDDVPEEDVSSDLISDETVIQPSTSTLINTPVNNHTQSNNSNNAYNQLPQQENQFKDIYLQYAEMLQNKRHFAHSSIPAQFDFIQETDIFTINQQQNPEEYVRQKRIYEENQKRMMFEMYQQEANAHDVNYLNQQSVNQQSVIQQEDICDNRPYEEKFNELFQNYSAERKLNIWKTEQSMMKKLANLSIKPKTENIQTVTEITEKPNNSIKEHPTSLPVPSKKGVKFNTNINTFHTFRFEPQNYNYVNGIFRKQFKKVIKEEYEQFLYENTDRFYTFINTKYSIVMKNTKLVVEDAFKSLVNMMIDNYLEREDTIAYLENITAQLYYKKANLKSRESEQIVQTLYGINNCEYEQLIKRNTKENAKLIDENFDRSRIKPRRSRKSKQKAAHYEHENNYEHENTYVYENNYAHENNYEESPAQENTTHSENTQSIIVQGELAIHPEAAEQTSIECVEEECLPVCSKNKSGVVYERKRSVLEIVIKLEQKYAGYDSSSESETMSCAKTESDLKQVANNEFIQVGNNEPEPVTIDESKPVKSAEVKMEKKSTTTKSALSFQEQCDREMQRFEFKRSICEFSSEDYVCSEYPSERLLEKMNKKEIKRKNRGFVDEESTMTEDSLEKYQGYDNDTGFEQEAPQNEGFFRGLCRFFCCG